MDSVMTAFVLENDSLLTYLLAAKDICLVAKLWILVRGCWDFTCASQSNMSKCIPHLKSQD